MAKSPVDKKMDEVEINFTKKQNKLYNELIDETEERLIKGDDIVQAVNKAFKETEAEKVILLNTEEAAISAIIVGKTGGTVRIDLDLLSVKDKKTLTGFVDHTTYGYTKRPLLKTLANEDFQGIVTQELRQQVAINGNWQKTAKSLTDKGFIKADLPKSLRQLERDALKAFDSNADITTFKSYKKAIRDTKRLSTTNATQGRLRKSYQNLINKANSGSKEAFQKAIDRAYKQKMAYNAERIARSESFFAVGQAQMERANDNEDIGYIKFNLDPSHPATDICDSYASADFYDLGAGMYPKDEAPQLPIHPNGRSTFLEIPLFELDDKVGKYNPDAMKTYLNKNPQSQKAILGVNGRKEFKKNPDSWKRNAKEFKRPPKYVGRIPSFEYNT